MVHPTYCGRVQLWKNVTAVAVMHRVSANAAVNKYYALFCSLYKQDVVADRHVGKGFRLSQSMAKNRPSWGVAELADAPDCFSGGEFIKVHLGGSNPSPPAYLLYGHGRIDTSSITIYAVWRSSVFVVFKNIYSTCWCWCI